MSNTWTDLLCILLILANLRMLGVSRLGACVRTSALQGVLLCLLPVAVTGELTWGLVPVVLLGLSVRGVLMPHLLWRAALKAGVRRELVPAVGFVFSRVAGVGLLVLCFLISRPLESAESSVGGLPLPVALFTIVTGFYLIIARRTAVMQALGYLVMENGIFAFGCVFAVREPALIEMGVLLDVLLGVFIMTIMIHHISREVDHLDTHRLSVLKD